MSKIVKTFEKHLQFHLTNSFLQNQLSTKFMQWDLCTRIRWTFFSICLQISCHSRTDLISIAGFFLLYVNMTYINFRYFTAVSVQHLLFSQRLKRTPKVSRTSLRCRLHSHSSFRLRQGFAILRGLWFKHSPVSSTKEVKTLLSVMKLFSFVYLASKTMHHKWCNQK